MRYSATAARDDSILSLSKSATNIYHQ